MDDATEAVNQVKRINASGWTAYICLDLYHKLSVRTKNSSFFNLQIIEVCKASGGSQ
tara:strand:+ start:237 stop:407 length:171 start_codon:yes stop_codon:yes gene_type:complete